MTRKRYPGESRLYRPHTRGARLPTGAAGRQTALTALYRALLVTGNRAAEPDVVIVMPCGYDAEIAHREAEMHRDELAGVGAGEVVAVDAAAYFSRPGPRIVDGLELLAHILHPERWPEAPAPVLPVEL